MIFFLFILMGSYGFTFVLKNTILLQAKIWLQSRWLWEFELDCMSVPKKAGEIYTIHLSMLWRMPVRKKIFYLFIVKSYILPFLLLKWFWAWKFYKTLLEVLYLQNTYCFRILVLFALLMSKLHVFSGYATFIFQISISVLNCIHFFAKVNLDRSLMLVSKKSIQNECPVSNAIWQSFFQYLSITSSYFCFHPICSPTHIKCHFPVKLTTV